MFLKQCSELCEKLGTRDQHNIIDIKTLIAAVYARRFKNIRDIIVKGKRQLL